MLYKWLAKHRLCCFECVVTIDTPSDIITDISVSAYISNNTIIKNQLESIGYINWCIFCLLVDS